VGGEEFGVLLPGYHAADSLALAENMRQAIWQLAIAHRNSSGRPGHHQHRRCLAVTTTTPSSN
jgi:PleD family two-component response regulator